MKTIFFVNFILILNSQRNSNFQIFQKLWKSLKFWTKKCFLINSKSFDTHIARTCRNWKNSGFWMTSESSESFWMSSEFKNTNTKLQSLIFYFFFQKFFCNWTLELFHVPPTFTKHPEALVVNPGGLWREDAKNDWIIVFFLLIFGTFSEMFL